MRRIEVPRDDKGRIVRAIVCLVELPHILEGRRVQVSDRTDHAVLVGVSHKGVLLDVQAQPAVGTGQHTLPILLLNHRAFGDKVRIIDAQVRHPVGLRPEQRLQVVRWNRLVIHRLILLRKRIVRSANILRQAIKVFIFLVLRRFEHHVFEQVREPRAIRRVVFATDSIADHDCDSRALMILDGKNPQPVGERAPARGPA